MDTLKFHFTAGAFIRRSVRVFLETNNISYKEHKGLLNSIFVCEGTREQYKVVKAMTELLN
jgi:hypothetical protein